jgi:hypothetical protein
MLELCLRLKILKLILNFYSLGVTVFFFQICGLKFLANFLLFIFFFEFAHFVHSFPNKNYQVRKILNQKTHVGWGGGFNLTI